MTGELTPDAGDVQRRTDRIAALDQHVGLLDRMETILDNLRPLDRELSGNLRRAGEIFLSQGDGAARRRHAQQRRAPSGLDCLRVRAARLFC